MTQDEYEVGSLENAEKFAIIRMARDAGFEGLIKKAWGIEQLKRFAALVAAHEREACAKVCDWYSNWNKDYREMRGFNDRLLDCAATIRERSANARARGNK